MNMLTAREIAQVLREAVAASRLTRRITQSTWDEIYSGLMTIDINGWVTFCRRWSFAETGLPKDAQY